MDSVAMIRSLTEECTIAGAMIRFPAEECIIAVA